MVFKLSNKYRPIRVLVFGSIRYREHVFGWQYIDLGLVI